MKLIIFSILLLTVLSTQITSTNDFESTTSIEDKVKAMQCVVESKDEIQDGIKLVKDILSSNFIGAIVDIYKMTKRLFKIIDDCGSLFCFGPSWQKCEAENSQGCEMNGLIVYPKCAEGYTNWACCVCANVCPSGFRDDGLYCAKPSAYGRGAGYVLWKRSKCESQNPQGCEKYGLIWYPKCKPGFHNVGCCICSPNCPSGWSDIGVSCKKPNSYGRGVGYPVSFGMKCMEHRANKLMASNCDSLKAELMNLQAQLEIKLQNAKENPKQYQFGMSDDIKDFAEKTEMYAQQCMEQKE